MDWEQVLIVLCVLLGFVQAQTPGQASLSTGPVSGTRVPINDGSPSASTKYMYTYRGIPYAMPPTGIKRFLAPSAPTSWANALTSRAVVPACPQSKAATSTLSTAEDCLYINVYTPEVVNAISSANPGLPVMVFIHGGAFKSGSGSDYAPDFLVANGVIFVSFNYRLGALGFLNLDSNNFPGNIGLLDQRFALQWVQKEIAAFGGDKTQVTLFGQGAGATSVAFHYISPASQGLFARAICESGEALSDRTFLKEGYVERAMEFARKINCTQGNNTSVDTLCLNKAAVQTIVDNQELTLSEEFVETGNDISFPPTMDIANKVNPVLPDTPANLLTSWVSMLTTNTSIARVPLLVGVNYDEGTIQVKSTTNYTKLRSNLRYFIPSAIRSRLSEADVNKKAESIFTEYFNVTEPSATNLDGFIKLYGDKMYKVPAVNFTRRLAGLESVRFYQFAYSGYLAAASTPDISKKIGHGDELKYLFYGTQTGLDNTTSTDTRMMNSMVTLWTNFAKTGNPTNTVGGTNTLLASALNWKTVSANVTPYLNIAETPIMATDNFLEKEFQFWAGLETIEPNKSFGTNITSSVLVLLAALTMKMLF